MNKFNEVTAIIAEVLETEVSNISMDSTVGSVENWDSIHQLMIISTLEESLGITFPEETLFELTNVKSIVEAVEQLS